jgi:LysR family glycine cleavage system transcriptional activator
VRIRSPSLSELHAFAWAVQTGSLARAAVQLSVTPAAISRSLSRLESRLGITLLQRHQLGVAPTAQGRAYFEKIQPALATLEDAAFGLVADTGRRQGQMSLRLAVIPSLNMRWLVPRLPQFHALHPHVKLVFKPYLIEDNFLREDVDCWIQTRPTRTHRWPRHVHARYIVGREITPICTPDFAAAIVTPEDLLRYPLLHHANYPGNWDVWLRAMGAGRRVAELGPGFDLVAGLVEAVLAGLGVAVVQRCLIERELAEGRLIAPFEQVVSTGRGYYLCSPKAREDNPAIQAFTHWLEATGRSGAPVPLK